MGFKANGKSKLKNNGDLKSVIEIRGSDKIRIQPSLMDIKLNGTTERIENQRSMLLPKLRLANDEMIKRKR